MATNSPAATWNFTSRSDPYRTPSTSRPPPADGRRVPGVVTGRAASTSAIRSADARAIITYFGISENSLSGSMMNCASPTAMTSSPMPIRPSNASQPAVRVTAAARAALSASATPAYAPFTLATVIAWLFASVLTFRYDRNAA